MLLSIETLRGLNLAEEKEEYDQLIRVKPDVLQAMILFKMYKTLQRIEKGQGKLDAFTTFMGPMTRMFKRDQQYQYATIPFGQHRRVWYMRNPQPDLLVGIITQVANDWFPNTFLEWSVDYEPKRVMYIIGQIDHPKEFERGIPFHDEVEWIAYNNDGTATATYDPTVGHTFGVLCDGFFIKKELYNQIVGK